MKIKDIENWNDSKQFEYYVNCFDRSMVLVFKDFEDYNAKELFDNLENNYFKWCDDDRDYCCEEYLLAYLPMIYSNNLICVIYEDDERKEDK